jgi:hypothetical protein
MNDEPSWIRDDLSSARFAPYLVAAHGNLAYAAALYWWNVEVSEAFYTSLHCLEMTFRNSLHRQLTVRYGRPDWWELAPLRASGPGMLTQAKAQLGGRTEPITHDHVVAALTLGFWVSLVSKAYDRSFWVPCLHKAFPRYRGPRAVLHHDLQSVQLFRNRVMHHEPIHHRHLAADHQTIRRLLGYISPAMVAQLAGRDRVPEVLRRRPKPPTQPGNGFGQ